MSASTLVRASRDGDQFHYLWAARRALQLLTPVSGLVAITVEGASTGEFKPGEEVKAGEELIDIAEYFGSVAIGEATLVRYVQLKHSTLHTNDPWQPSGLEKTISGFAKRYAALRQKFPVEALGTKLEFHFVTNRPVGTSFLEAVDDVAAQRAPRHPDVLVKLKTFTALDDAALAEFCAMLRLTGREDGYWTQRNILFQEASGYLPTLDVEAPIRLKELINRKALSESATNPAITKMDVLRALQTDEAELFPCPCMIGPIHDAVPRRQEKKLVEVIVATVGKPVIVQADAGVGKSVFSTRIGMSLPAGSVSIVYDCFGNGQYRNASGYRHRHRTALVQIANELSAIGLCHPLIPAPSADPSAYMRAFLHRLHQAISMLRAQSADAIIAVIVDAADNAQMAAEEIGERHSFIRDLVRETLPEGIRIIALSRPHRVKLLDPPPNTLNLVLEPFCRDETAAHLRHTFSSASEHDVDEFHRLSSHNPRLQALALSRHAPLPETLRLLGPNPTTVDSAIGAILEESIVNLRDAVGHVERAQVDLICAGLAALRPLIPLSVLASVSGVDQAAIKCFALDVGRPLVVNGDTIQFFDEPAETWFRDRFRPNAENLKDFISRLKPLSGGSAYVASALPQLMLEAGQFSELVELALTSSGLPEASPVERRDVELQRLQFALKAGLRTRRYLDSAKLALKAGGESAGDDRQRRLLQDNVDLVSRFMDSNGVQELVSRHTFGSSWLGSHHVYEAAVLSGHSELVGEARSRIRMAEEWLLNWSKLPPEEREKESVSDEDRAVLAFAHFNVHGAEEAAYSLRRWRPRELSYSAGRILVRRFLEHGRYDDVDALAIAAGNDVGLILAIAIETRSLHRLLPRAAAERGFRILSNRRVTVRDPKSANELALSAIAALVETAIRHGICDASEAMGLLERYLPEKPSHSLVSRFAGPRLSYMRAHAIHGALAGMPLQLVNLATDELRKEMDNEKRHSESQQLREFKEDIGALIPWCNLWARAVLGKVTKAELDRAIAGAMAESAKAESSYSDRVHTSDEIAGVWIDILLNAGGADEAALRALVEWAKSAKRQLNVPTLNHLARLSAQISGCEHLAFEFAQATFSLLRDERSDAQYKAEGYVDISRSILTASIGEAEAYFDQAMEVASKIGDENLARWDALIYLAERSARPQRPSARIAYKFARCAEVTRSYVDRDKYFAWTDTVKALTGLCPSSSLAIASRWRDRRFGRDGRVVAAAVESLVESSRLNALDAAAMVGFRADWNEIRSLELALSGCNKEAKGAVLRLIYRYMVLAGSGAVDKWRRLAAIADREGLTLPGLETRIADAEAQAAQEAVKEGRTRHYSAAASTNNREERDWDAVFDTCDVTTADGISTAYQRFRGGDAPYYTEEFFGAATKRVPVGREADFVRAFGDVAEFDLYSLRALLEGLPDNWQSRLSVRASLAETIRGLCRRHCMAVRRNKHYEVLPIEKACELSGLDQAELIELVLDAVGESAELAGAERLFSLIGLLSGKLTDDEALDALSYGLDLFNDVLEETDGDGPWAEPLAPPTPIEDALAGYIWAGLASPVAATRWEAAHVVVALCALGRTRVLAGLFSHAVARTSVPFADARLQFYGLHAQQWLMIAAARAASEYGSALAPHANQILAYASPSQLHVLTRLFAARTALSLSAQGILELQPEARQQLAKLNSSPFEPIVLDPSEEYSTTSRAKSLDGAEWKDQYLFGIDFGPYWLAPLGRCFGIGQSEIEQETLKVMRDELQYEGTHHRNEDERARVGVYDWRETRHSHGSYPSVDDQSFYLSYHAMMIVAGRLLATRPLIKGKNDWEDNRFLDWIARHDVSRNDGRWLADRRDPQPVSRLTCIEENSKAGWNASISAEEFELALQPIPGYVTAWGHWSEIESSRKESVSVYTALVSRQRSASLLRALQTTNNPYDFRIPSADDELEIERAPYRLKGWIIDRPNDGRLDDSDPWAGQVRFPAPEPASFVIESMELSADSDRRIWRSASSKMPELQSEAWGGFRERDDFEQPSGSRLLASIHFLVEFLTRTDMDLIVEVQLQHISRYERYGNRNSDEEVGDIPPSSRIFVIKSNGTIRGL